MSVKDLDRSHRIGKRNSKSKRRPITIKFISYNNRREIFNNKKQLKGTGVSITESLTAERVRQLKIARDQSALKMCGQLMGESCTKTAPAQNQNYFMDKW